MLPCRRCLRPLRCDLLLHWLLRRADIGGVEHFRYKETPGLHPKLAALIETLEDGTREWLDELLPFEDLSMDWRPYPGAPCAGGILLHIMAAERFWIDMVAHGRELSLDDPALEYDSRLDQYSGIWPDPPEQPFSWYLDLLRTHRARTIELIKEHNDPDRVHQKDEYADFDFAWIVGHLVQHDSYHGGQIVLLNELRKRSLTVEAQD